jgi:hypothetical protein
MGCRGKYEGGKTKRKASGYRGHERRNNNNKTKKKTCLVKGAKAKFIDHAESRYEGETGQEVDGGRDEVASGKRQGLGEHAPARGVTDARYLLYDRIDEVEDEKADEERVESGSEEHLALLRTRGSRRVDSLAKVQPKPRREKVSSRTCSRAEGGQSTGVFCLHWSRRHAPPPPSPPPPII